MNRSNHHHKAKYSSSDLKEESGKLLNTKSDIQNHGREEIVEDYPDYPAYPPSEDIYSNYEKEEKVDIEHPYTVQSTTDKNRPLTLTETEGENVGAGLDIPGSELDDELEFIGSEDEENNYYSLGGDNHDNLEEFRDDNL